MPNDIKCYEDGCCGEAMYSISLRVHAGLEGGAWDPAEGGLCRYRGGSVARGKATILENKHNCFDWKDGLVSHGAGWGRLC